MHHQLYQAATLSETQDFEEKARETHKIDSFLIQ